MKQSKQLIDMITNTAQLGQISIETLLQTAMRPTLRKALHTQLAQFVDIERQAQALANSRGWELGEPEPTAKFLAKAKIHLGLSCGNTDSKIAALVIRSNTKDLIDGLSRQHQFNWQDPQACQLSQRLADCQNAGIRQMQGFL